MCYSSHRKLVLGWTQFHNEKLHPLPPLILKFPISFFLTFYLPQLFSLTFLQLLPISFFLQLPLTSLFPILNLFIRLFPLCSFLLPHFLPTIPYFLFATCYSLGKIWKSEVGRRQCKDIWVLLWYTFIFEKEMSLSSSTCLEKSMNINNIPAKIHWIRGTMQLTVTQPHESLSSAAIYLHLRTLDLTGKCYSTKEFLIVELLKWKDFYQKAHLHEK